MHFCFNNICRFGVIMNQKLCFLFGHAAMFQDMTAQIKAVAQCHYLDHGIRTFVVGNRASVKTEARFLLIKKVL